MGLRQQLTITINIDMKIRKHVAEFESEMFVNKLTFTKNMEGNMKNFIYTIHIITDQILVNLQ